jgi:serralysin
MAPRFSGAQLKRVRATTRTLGRRLWRRVPGWLAMLLGACLALTDATQAYGDTPDRAAPAATLRIGDHGLRLSFDDEFETLNLRRGDEGVWSTSYGYRGIANFTLPTNRELQLYVDPDFVGAGSRPLRLQPFAVRNGILDITADRAPQALRRAMWGYRYYSGLLTTRRSFAQQYGYFEIRARFPATPGAWPAFWLLPANGAWPPELDVLEYLGRDPNVYWAGFHTTVSGYRTTPVTQRVRIAGPSGQFHTYGLLWDREAIVWYLDGAEVRRIATPGDMHAPMYLLVNLAIGGGGWSGAPNFFTRFPMRMSVDYVRAYALEAP